MERNKAIGEDLNMARKLIDLSISIEDGLPSDPPQMIPRIHYVNHDAAGSVSKVW